MFSLCGISLCVLFIVDMILGSEESSLIVNTSDIFLGFGHPAVITVAAVLIISCALRNSGVVDLISRYISPLSKNMVFKYVESLSPPAFFNISRRNISR